MYKLLLLDKPLSQAARPRVFITHLQLGLGVQLHHYFGSKYLIEILYPGQFVQYVADNVDHNIHTIDGKYTFHGMCLIAGQFVQYVADNVDHNIHTIDGKYTFHGMCLIAAVTPSVRAHRDIPRLKVTTSELEEIDKSTFI